MISFESYQKVALIFNALLIIYSHFRGPVAVEYPCTARVAGTNYNIFLSTSPFAFLQFDA
jgi:hypothetical protein